MGIEIKGLDSLLKKFETLEKDVQSNIDNELTASASNVSNEAKRLAPIDESRLRGSIVADTNAPLLKKVTANIFYAPYIEFGTKKKVKVPTGLESYAAGFKGKAGRGDFEQFVDSIEAWMKRKGIKAATQIEFVNRGGLKKAKKRSSLSQAIAQRQLARHIALRIMQNGIAPQPFFFKPFFDETPLLISRLKKIINPT